ncbi:MAG: J domain-containing protein [Sphingomonas adhaesiva]|uniref:J domain-containing protein n=1 Tax=Sphingomonas adhaesiva TaxID=28212 RepID=UPI002FF926BF
MKWIVAAAIIAVVWLLLRKPARRKPSAVATARGLLGVAKDADAATIRAAHRRLVADVHPDRGGSAEATRRANAARDLLLERLRRE